MQKKQFRGMTMKILRGAAQVLGYQIVHLVDPEDSGILRFEETGEIPEGMDFAVRWKGVWREGRCYDSGDHSIAGAN